MIKILVPIDFSESSKKALEYAVHLGKSVDVAIDLLHITSSPVKTGTKLIHKMQEAAMAEDRDIVDRKIKEFLKGIKKSKYLNHTAMIRYGDVSKQIVNVSLQEDFNLVIMGTKGASWLKEKFIGSNTFSSLKLSILPVIVVPRAYNIAKAGKRALIALKFEKLYTQSCENLLSKTKSLGFASELVTIVDGKSDKIGMTIKHNKKSFPVVILDNKQPRKAISKYVKNEDVDLLALHFNSYSFFKELTYHSVSNEFTFRSSIPILFMK